MASALEEREEQSSKCFICNIKVTTRSSYDIYCTFMPQREVLLMDVMSKILKKIFNPSQIRSSVLCRRQVLRLSGPYLGFSKGGGRDINIYILIIYFLK